MVDFCKKLLYSSKMITTNLSHQPHSNEEIIGQVCNFIKLDNPVLNSEKVEENIKDLCITKLCHSIGIKCACNHKNSFFNFFSSIMGEAIVSKLGFNIKVDEYNLKYIKFNDVNLVYSALFMLESFSIDEAFLKVYNLANAHKHLIKNA